MAVNFAFGCVDFWGLSNTEKGTHRFFDRLYKCLGFLGYRHLALHDLADDILPLSRLFLHINCLTREIANCRRESIEPIQEVDDEEEHFRATFAALPQAKRKTSVVSRLSMRFQRFTGLSEFRRNSTDGSSTVNVKTTVKKSSFIAHCRKSSA